ncbi:hypothetical protein SFOMI_4919 [Sphingobium fuliginis]|uniref:Conjugal transfer protein TraF n=1 Tax=Sphingobium fuliginis (strain ATCC 27551) TaxID=336203 RepID=A0A292ZN76_SPHSA|nr:hypothetical protein SFOMI_4919 [Sphingobium fuliginis]
MILSVRHVMETSITLKLRAPVALLPLALLAVPAHAFAAGNERINAERAAIHPVTKARELNAWLARVPRTREFPTDLDPTLRAEGRTFLIEMSSAPGCLPCGDLWARLLRFGHAYGWQVRTIPSSEALLRSGRLGLPWVGHPVLWVRPANDPVRLVPAAIGTDHDENLRRNIYLAAKILTGVRPEIGLRAMSKYTGIVAPSGAAATSPQRRGS